MSVRASKRYSTSLSMEEVTELLIGTAAEPSVISTFTKRQLLIVTMMATVNFCSSVLYSLIAPFYPQEASSKGVSSSVIGFIFGSIELTIAITSPFFGRYITYLGSRFTFIAGMFTVGISCILFGFLDLVPSGVDFIALSIAIRVVEGLGAAAYITASFSIIANEFPERVATMFGLLETFNGLGLMLGPPIGGALYTAGGFKLPFLVLGGILLLAVFIAYWFLPEQPDDDIPITQSYFSFLTTDSVLLCMVTICVGSMSMGFLQPTLEPHLEQFNMNAFVIGLVFLCTSSCYALSAPIWGFIGDKFGYTLQMMVIGCIFTSLSFFFVGPSPVLNFDTKLWLVVVSQIALGMGTAAQMVPPFKFCLIQIIGAGFPDNFETYGLLSGMYSTCFSFGAFIGPTVAGALVDAIGFESGTSIFSAINIALALIVLCYLLYFTFAKKKQATTPLCNSFKYNSYDSINERLIKT